MDISRVRTNVKTDYPECHSLLSFILENSDIVATNELTFLVSIRTTLAGQTLSCPDQENPYAAINVLLNLKKNFQAEDLDILTLRTATVQIIDYEEIEARILSRPSLRLY